MRAAFQQPFLIALLSSAILSLGVGLLFSKEQLSDRFGKKGRPGFAEWFFATFRKEGLYMALSSLGVTTVIFLWTNSLILTLPFTFFSLLITWVYLRKKAERIDSLISQMWPEVIDHIISGIHSGLSLSESMVGLKSRGPELLRPAFAEFNQDLLGTGNFTEAVQKLKVRFNSQGSDQILEAILLAKSLGGSELLQIFRTLGDFLRQDLALRKEIEIKHGWIKNSAHLSAAAPWLLLLLLSTQPGTAQSFAQPGGVLVIFGGIFLTLLAYFWMGRLGKLPSTPRTFNEV